MSRMVKQLTVDSDSLSHWASAEGLAKSADGQLVISPDQWVPLMVGSPTSCPMFLGFPNWAGDKGETSKAPFQDSESRQRGL